MTHNNTRRGWALFRGQRGITGLETAIVLIAFVVVSSVFAFASLSTGLFSSDKAKETIQAGLSEAQGTMELKGEVKALATITTNTDEAVGSGDGVTTAFNLAKGPVIRGSVTVKVDGVAQTEGADYTVSYDVNPGVVTFTAAPANATNITATYKDYVVNDLVFGVANAAGGKAVDLTPGETVLTYQDDNNLASNVTNFTVTWIGTNDGDSLLEDGEQAVLTVPVDGDATGGPYNLATGMNFSVQVKPQAGAVVMIGRKMPANISAAMVIN